MTFLSVRYYTIHVHLKNRAQPSVLEKAYETLWMGLLEIVKKIIIYYGIIKEKKKKTSVVFAVGWHFYKRTNCALLFFVHSL
jgi:hypothetical protein